MASVAYTVSVVFFLGLVSNQVLAATDTCEKEGNFESENCHEFYQCSLDRSDGQIKRMKRSCGEKAFDEASGTCVPPSKVNCNVRQGRHYESSARYDKLCKGKSFEFLCGDCQTQITCSDGKAYPTKCEDDLRCMNAEGFSGGVCHFNFDDTCRCKEPNSYRKDPYYNGTFFLCEAENAVPNYYNCPSSMYFNETEKKCINNDGTPACTERGIFTYPNDCSKYYMCTHAVEGWVQTKLSCPEGQLLNAETEQCEVPCDWFPEDFTCTAQGRFKIDKDCSKFVECIQNKENKLIAIERSCPPYRHWNEDSKTCITEIQSNCAIKTSGKLDNCRANVAAVCQDKTEESDATEDNSVNEIGENASPDSENAAPDSENATPDSENAPPDSENASPDSENAPA